MLNLKTVLIAVYIVIVIWALGHAIISFYNFLFPSDRNVVDSFIQKQDNVDTITMLENFQMFYANNKENEYMDDAEKYVVRRLEKEVVNFLKKVECREFTETDFSELRYLAKNVKNSNGSNIRNSKISKWLSEYAKWRKENKTFKVTMGDMVAIASYRGMKDPISITRSCGIDPANMYKDDSYHHIGKDKYSIVKSWNPPSMEMTIAQKWSFDTTISDWRVGGKVGRIYHQIYLGLEDLDLKYDRLTLSCNTELGKILQENSDYAVKIKINDFCVHGEPFYRWLKNHPCPVEI